MTHPRTNPGNVWPAELFHRIVSAMVIGTAEECAVMRDMHQPTEQEIMCVVLCCILDSEDPASSA